MDFPQEGLTPYLVHTGMANISGLGDALFTLSTRTTAAISPVSGTAVYIPVTFPWTYLAKRAFWANGSTVTSAENDFGIYTTSGTRIYHTGKKALSGASGPQFVSTGNLVVAPGEYYFALFVTGTTTSRWNGYTGVESARTAGCLSQAGLTELPEEATFAAAVAAMPICGVTKLGTGL